MTVDVYMLCNLSTLSSVHVQLGRTVLMEAVQYGHPAVVQYLVEKTTSQVNATNKVSHSNNACARTRTTVSYDSYMSLTIACVLVYMIF